jgi:gluconate kinase
MGSIDAPRRWEGWVAKELTEKRPRRQLMTDTERLNWFEEYGRRFNYKTRERAYVVFDCMGQKTQSRRSLRDAIDLAAAKFYAANE